MKKYLMVLMSVGFLSAGANAATDPSLTSLPHWGDFRATNDPAFTRGYETHRQEVTALKTAYDAWLPGYLAAHPALAGAGFRAAAAPVVGRTGAKKTAAAVMADPDTVGKLARHHKRDLITAMAADPAITAGEIEANADLKRELATTHRDAMIAAMATHSVVDTAAEVVANPGLRGTVTNQIAADAGHRQAMLARLGSHHAADTAAAVVANDALRAEVITALQNGHHALSKPTFVDILHRIRDAIAAPADVGIQNAVRDAARAGLTDGLGAGDAHFADEADIRGADIV